jgi:hypothetical protein
VHIAQTHDGQGLFDDPSLGTIRPSGKSVDLFSELIWNVSAAKSSRGSKSDQRLAAGAERLLTYPQLVNQIRFS